MLKYKALYKKMMDDLKDGGMWLDWAEKLKEDCPEVAQYLAKSAAVRIDSNYPETKKLFDHICEEEMKKADLCMNELIDEQFDEWHEELVNRLKKMK